MRKISLLLASTLIAAGCLAQPKLGVPQKIAGGDTGFMNPSWSPDGKKIAMTGDNYSGIWVANADGTALTKLTADAGAGYKMAWSDDGSSILSRTNVYKDNKTYHELKVFEVRTMTAQTLVEATRNLGAPVWRDAAAAITKDGQAAIAKKGGIEPASLSVYETMVTDPFHALAKLPGMEEFAGKPVINPALSPDKTKIAFQIPGKGVFVCDAADGGNSRRIGRGSYPAWTPGNKYVIVAKVTDNGETFTASELVAIDTDTTATTTIFSDSAMIPLTPAVSPDGKKLLVENCADGGIYMMDITY